MDDLYISQEASLFEGNNQIAGGILFQGNLNVVDGTVNFNSGGVVRQTILQWLSPIPYEQHHNANKQGVLEGTGSWLLEEEAVAQWRDLNKSSVLWLHGIPGCGKTKLVSIVIRQLLANPKDGYCLAYFYCSRNTAEPERSNPEDIFRSIVRQMSSPSPGEPILSPAVEKYDERKKMEFANGPLSLEESVEVIIKLTTHYLRTTIVIDALDECDKNAHHKMLKALNSILKNGSGSVKIFVSSRDDQYIHLCLESSPNLYIKVSDNAADIHQYVQDEVRQAIDDKRLLGGRISEQLRQEIIRTLTKRAQGMFLWVSLQLQNLCSSRINLEKDLLEELGRLPQDLTSIYSEIYKEISNLGSSSRTIAERSLKWILCSQKRLSVNEFLAAISADSEETLTEVRKEDVLRVCCNLIIFDPELDIFRFAHLSVREFLEGQEEYTSIAAHALAAERCLTVCLENISASVAVPAANTAFRDYAVLHWPIHCHMSEGRRSKDKLGDLFHDLLRQQLGEISPFTQWTRLAEAALSPYTQEDDGIQRRVRSMISCPPDPIFAACVWGFSEIIEDLLGPKSKRRFEFIQSLLGSKLKVLKKMNSEGETCLQCASRYGHCKVARLLVEKGADVNAKTSYGRTALHEAVGNRHEAVVRLLVEMGADVNTEDGYGETALQLGARNGHEAVVRLLVEQGADVNAKTSYGRTVLHEAARNGHEAVVRLLVEKGANFSTEDKYWGTVLQLEARNGHEAVVRLLVERGADVNAKTSRGRTVLHEAADSGHEAVVRLLVEKGADVNTKDTDGETALHLEARNGHEAVVRLLVENGADVNVKTSYGSTALHLATRYGHEAVVLLLVEKGANINAKDRDGETALHLEARNGHKAVVRMLMEKGADVNAKTGYGSTALHLATRHGHKAVVRMLMEKGADVNAKTGYGSTALHLATRHGYKAVVRLLVGKGADVNAEGRNGSTALHLATRYRHEAVVRMLVEKGADVNAKDRHGRTALHLEAGNRNGTVVGLLVEKGADVNAKTGYGSTALHLAACYGHEAVARLLVEKGADANTEDRNGSTALHLATSYGHEAVVRLLAEKGADVNAKDRDGRTALYLAARYGHGAVVRLLTPLGPNS